MSITKAKITKNPPAGSTLEEGIPEQPEAAALKRLIASRLVDLMKEQKLKKAPLAKRMHTSRASLDRLLDASNTSVTLTTLTRVAAALGRRVKIEFVRA
jgi:antitoxin HicB